MQRNDPQKSTGQEKNRARLLKLENKLAAIEEEMNQISSTLVYIKGKNNIGSLNNEELAEFLDLKTRYQLLTLDRNADKAVYECIRIELIEDPQERKKASAAFEQAREKERETHLTNLCNFFKPYLKSNDSNNAKKENPESPRIGKK